jgi:NADH-quinone oxidoreductase subunit M
MTSMCMVLSVLLPILGAAAALLAGDANAARWGRLAAALNLIAAVGLAVGVAREGASAPLVWPWMPSLGANLVLVADGLAAPFVLLVAVQTQALLAGADSPLLPRPSGWIAGVLAMAGIVDLLFVAGDLMTFFLAWELTLVPMHALLAGWGTGPERRHAAARYTLTMLVGGVPLLLGLLVFALAGDTPTFSLAALASMDRPREVQILGGALLTLGRAFKAPIVPLHGWMPPVMTEGPAPVGVWAVGLKLGAWGMLRLLFPLAPALIAEWGPTLSLLGLLGVAYGAIVSLDQPGMRRLIAFSGVSHVGMVVLGIGAGTPVALQGAAVQLFAFGLGAASLSLLASALRDRLGTTDRAALGGLAVRMPRWTALAVLAAAVSVGVPGTIGFVGELLVVVGAFPVEPGLVVLALVSLAIGVAALADFLVAAVRGPVERRAVAQVADLTPAEMRMILPLLLLALASGVWPAPLLDVASPTLHAAAGRVAGAQRALDASVDEGSPLPTGEGR